ncbi:MAG TPA: hypothetical protein PK156_37450 [Polyangium sp.]|nr:hypothetical protein [Polyangium sp.]
MRTIYFPILIAVVGGAIAGACTNDTNTNAAQGGTAAGGPGGGGGTGGKGGGQQAVCIDGLKSITLSPADSSVKLDGNTAMPISFTATGTFADGHSAPIDGTKLDWTVMRQDDTSPGMISAGVLSPFPGAGGVVTVKATDSCVSASTTVTFSLEVVVGMPTDPGPWNTTPVNDAKSPLIVYPSDQTRFPRNIYRTLFQWRTQGFTEFRLKFTGPHSTVTVYTDGTHGLCAGKNPAAGCWEVDEIDWNYIAGSNAGETAQWTVAALDKTKTPPVVHESAPITIGFSKQDVKGAIFYWSTTSAGVRRGKISRQNPEDYIVAKPPTTYPDGDAVKCVACHVVSRDGKYMAAPVSASSGQSVWVLGVTANAPPDPLVKKIDNSGGHAFATISPDDKYVIVSIKGKMWVVNRETGAFVKDIDTGALGGTHPDWSPLGDKVVFATGSGDGPSGSSLAILPVSGDAMFAAPTVLLPPPSGLSNLFPSFSPQADWIAYAKGKGGHGDNTAQLMLISQAGGQPIELINANRMTSNAVTDGQYQNSQPTWAPPGDYNWVAFNTKREYGVVLPEGTQQIWVAAIDLNQAKSGADPSFPAFRVPFQGLAENNHRAYWTLDINDSGTGGGGGAGGGSTSGGGGMGGAPQCGSIAGLGDPCDPVFDCCETGTICDTNDSGVTYVCVTPP